MPDIPRNAIDKLPNFRMKQCPRGAKYRQARKGIAKRDPYCHHSFRPDQHIDNVKHEGGKHAHTDP